MATKKTPLVTQDASAPVEKAILAQAIVDMSRAAQRLAASGLNKKSIAVLIHYHSKVPLRDIELVLEHLQWLERNCTK